jgi:hypothetical protein
MCIIIFARRLIRNEFTLTGQCGFETRSTIEKLIWLILEVTDNPDIYDYSTGHILVFLLDSYG